VLTEESVKELVDIVQGFQGLLSRSGLGIVLLRLFIVFKVNEVFVIKLKSLNIKVEGRFFGY
jgi:hypothetical protein